jgi:hypothetical protein
MRWPLGSQGRPFVFFPRSPGGAIRPLGWRAIRRGAGLPKSQAQGVLGPLSAGVLECQDRAPRVARDGEGLPGGGSKNCDEDPLRRKPREPTARRKRHERYVWMARKMTEWPAKRRAITKIMPSDGCKGMSFPWRWDSSTISTKLDVIWGMSVKYWYRSRGQARRCPGVLSLLVS